MKKIFSIFTVALMALSFAGCNNPEPELLVKFEINNINVGTTTATVEITPDNLDVWYMRDYFVTSLVENGTFSSTWEAAKGGLSVLKIEGFTYEQLKEMGAIVKGKQTWEIDGLLPGTGYSVVTYIVDENLNIVGNSFGTGFFHTYAE